MHCYSLFTRVFEKVDRWRVSRFDFGLGVFAFDPLDLGRVDVTGGRDLPAGDVDGPQGFPI